MRIPTYLVAALLEASAVFAAPWSSSEALPLLFPRGVSPSKASKRPNHPIAPKHPGHPFPVSPARSKTCTVKSHGNGKDDSAYVLNAIRDCNDGGHVVFEKGKKYVIGTALDLTFLKHIDLGMHLLIPSLAFLSLCSYFTLRYPGYHPIQQ